VSSNVRLIKKKDEFLVKRSMNVPRSKVSLAVGKCTDSFAGRTYIFAVGGQESALHASRAVERYHTRADIWQQLPTLNEARAEASSCVIGDCLYVFGGLSVQAGVKIFTQLKTIEKLSLRFSKDTLTFTQIEPKLPFGVSNIGVVPIS